MQKNEKKKKESLSTSENNKKVNIVKIISYIIFLFVSLYMYNKNGAIKGELGDFNTLVPILLNLVIVITLKWLPILSFFGIVLEIISLKIEEGLKEFSKTYFVVIIVLFLVGIGGIFCLG